MAQTRFRYWNTTKTITKYDLDKKEKKKNEKTKSQSNREKKE